MSRRVRTNISKGHELMPLKEAADLVSYSKDYVAKLARQKKIKAKQIDRKWMVSLDSLKDFALVSDYEKKLRSQELSDQRKTERLVKENVLEQDRKVRSKINQASTSALKFSLAVMLLGVFSGLGLFGFGGFLGSNLTGQLAGLVMSLEDSSSSTDNSEVFPQTTNQELAIHETVTLEPVFETTVSHERITSGQSMVVLSKDDVLVEDVEEVTGLFSDEVIVIENMDGEARVFTTNERGEPVGEGLLLLAIPILKANGQTAE